MITARPIVDDLIEIDIPTKQAKHSDSEKYYAPKIQKKKVEPIKKHNQKNK